VSERDGLDWLPETYAAAIRLRKQGLDDDRIAAELGLEPEAVGPLLLLAEAKIAARHASESEEGTHEADEGRSR
jgi:orotate phosphoribosyltransferase-like protein